MENFQEPELIKMPNYLGDINDIDPLLTIVTITKSDEDGLFRTISSLKKLKDVNIELIVVSGDLNNFVSFSELAFDQIEIINGQSDGIYTAMNVGVAKSKGKYLWFLNGGDENLLTTIKWLQYINIQQPEKILLFDYLISTNRKFIPRQSRDIGYLWHGLPTSHQAIFFPGEAIRNALYNSDYKIAGDYELLARLIKLGIQAVQVKKRVASFAVGGTANQNLKLLRKEAARVQHDVLGLSAVSIKSSQVKHIISGWRWKIIEKVYS
jgi:putative colanic acid biosynthesis glycosyltransferase